MDEKDSVRELSDKSDFLLIYYDGKRASGSKHGCSANIKKSEVPATFTLMASIRNEASRQMSWLSLSNATVDGESASMDGGGFSAVRR